jgi:hypothetical protein
MRYFSPRIVARSERTNIKGFSFLNVPWRRVEKRLCSLIMYLTGQVSHGVGLIEKKRWKFFRVTGRPWILVKQVHATRLLNSSAMQQPGRGW